METAIGVSESIEFRLIQAGTFSPSTINWTLTTPLPQPLQALGAAFVPVEEGATPATYVFVAGGADSLAVATDVVYRAEVEASGAPGGDEPPHLLVHRLGGTALAGPPKPEIHQNNRNRRCGVAPRVLPRWPSR